MTDWRDRIVEIKRMRVGDLSAHAQNPKRHPKQQAAAITGLLNEVGKAGVLMAYHSERAGGLVLWDGHLRQGLDPNQEWHVAITDLTDAEAALMLATYDPLAALAEVDAEKLAAILAEVNTGEAALQEMLDGMAIDAGIVPPDNPTEHWRGMPGFENENVFDAIVSLKVHIATQEDLERFAELMEQTVTKESTFIWFPKREREDLTPYRVVDES